jgi:hypothetical protein
LASSWDIPAFTVTHSRPKSRKWLTVSLSKSDDQKTGGPMTVMPQRGETRVASVQVVAQHLRTTGVTQL